MRPADSDGEVSVSNLTGYYLFSCIFQLYVDLIQHLDFFLMSQSMQRKPEWLKLRFSVDAQFSTVRQLLARKGLHTVCRSAKCPNLQECWSRGTATFLLLGNVCTRSCRFCAVGKDSRPGNPDAKEPQKIAEAIGEMALRHVVLTSVNRDDLPDGGAGHWVDTLQSIRMHNPEVTVECLIPDFLGNEAALDLVLTAAPDVLNHNIETVPRLYPKVRPEADYSTSLRLLRRAADRFGLIAKSGMMVGMGETGDEVLRSLQDLREHGCDIVTIGQYLQPTAEHLQVERYVTPDEFKQYEERAIAMGFRHVLSGPFVRSSYHAEEAPRLKHLSLSAKQP